LKGEEEKERREKERREKIKQKKQKKTKKQNALPSSLVQQHDKAHSLTLPPRYIFKFLFISKARAKWQ
jgi:hypothetical protein